MHRIHDADYPKSTKKKTDMMLVHITGKLLPERWNPPSLLLSFSSLGDWVSLDAVVRSMALTQVNWASGCVTTAVELSLPGNKTVRMGVIPKKFDVKVDAWKSP